MKSKYEAFDEKRNSITEELKRVSKERKLGEVDIQIVNLSLMFLVTDVLIDIAESLDELARR